MVHTKSALLRIMDHMRWVPYLELWIICVRCLTQNYGSYALGALLRIMDHMRSVPYSELWIICASALLLGENKLLVHRKINLICLYFHVISQRRINRENLFHSNET